MKSYISRKFPLETRITDQTLDLRSLERIVGSMFLDRSATPLEILQSLSFRIRGRVETIPYPRFSVNVFWLSRIHFNLFPKLVDHHAQRFRLFPIFRPP